MGVNINAEHRLVAVDDSGISSVALCACGRSWVSVGEERVQEARYQHARHVYEASYALIENTSRPRSEPVRGEMSPAPTNPRGRPMFGGVSRAERIQQVAALRSEGRTSSEIASILGLGIAYVQKVVQDVEKLAA